MPPVMIGFGESTGSKIAHSALLAIVFAALIWSGPAAAYEPKGELKVTVKVDRLHVRSGPSTRYRVVGSLKKGDVVSVERVEGRWIKLDRDEPAFIHIKFVALPEGFDPPGLSDAEDAFIGWAVRNTAIDELGFEGPGEIWVVLDGEEGVSKDHAIKVAKLLACRYREQTGFKDRAVVTVFPPGESPPPVAEAACG